MKDGRALAILAVLGLGLWAWQKAKPAVAKLPGEAVAELPGYVTVPAEVTVPVGAELPTYIAEAYAEARAEGLPVPQALPTPIPIEPRFVSYSIPETIQSGSEFWATQKIYLPYSQKRTFLPLLKLGSIPSNEAILNHLKAKGIVPADAYNLTVSQLAMSGLSAAVIGTPPYIYCWETLDSSKEYTIKGMCSVWYSEYIEPTGWQRKQEPAKASFYCSSMMYYLAGISYMLEGGWYPLPPGRYDIISYLRYGDVVGGDEIAGWWDIWRDVKIGEVLIV